MSAWTRARASNHCRWINSENGDGWAFILIWINLVFSRSSNRSGSIRWHCMHDARIKCLIYKLNSGRLVEHRLKFCGSGSKLIKLLLVSIHRWNLRRCCLTVFDDGTKCGEQKTIRFINIDFLKLFLRFLIPYTSSIQRFQLNSDKVDSRKITVAWIRLVIFNGKFCNPHYSYFNCIRYNHHDNCRAWFVLIITKMALVASWN